MTASHTFIRVVPRDFGSTVFDTSDLSIVRGSSLTLLAMPELLAAAVQEAFSDITFEVQGISASELTLLATKGGGGGLQVEGVEPKHLGDLKLKNPAKKVWNRVFRDPESLSKKIGSQTPEAYFAFASGLKAQLGEKFSGTVDDIAGHAFSILRRGTEDPFQALTDSTADAVRTWIQTWLANPQDGWPFDLFSFSVAVRTPADGESVLETFDALATELGLIQMRSLSCPLPPDPVPLSGSPEDMICGYTHVLASKPGRKVKGRPMSPSAERRHEVGRKQKQNFYRRVLEDGHASAQDVDPRLNKNAQTCLNMAIGRIETALPLLDGKLSTFASDFEQIAGDASPRGRSKSVAANLAVVHMDGNSFGKMARDVLEADGLKGARYFGNYLDALKAGLLAEILIWLAQTDGAVASRRDSMEPEADAKPIARFETLLWGGDEFMFVLPSEFAFGFLKRVHTATRNWVSVDRARMTFGVGTAIAPYHTPIADLRSCADDLSGMAKATDRRRTLVQFLVLEGVDRIHLDPVLYRRHWLDGDVAESAFSIELDALERAERAVQHVLDSVGRSQVLGWYERSSGLVARHGDQDRVAKTVAEIARDSARTSSGDPWEKLCDAGLGDGSTYPLVPLAQAAMLLDYFDVEGART